MNMYWVESSIDTYIFKNSFSTETLKRSSKLQNLGINSINGIPAILNSVAYVEALISALIVFANINARIVVLIPVADIEAHIPASIPSANIESCIVAWIPVADIDAHILILTPVDGITVCTW